MSAEFTHKQAIAALDAGELAALKETADGPGLKRLAVHLGLLGATGLSVLTLPAGVPWLIVLIAHSILLVFLFTAAHEAIHGTAFRSAWINEAVATGAGFLLLLPPRWFRYYHLAHHRFTQDPANDPELASPRPAGWPAYLLYLSGLPYWQAMAAALLNDALRRDPGPFVPKAARARVRSEARAYLAAYAALAGASAIFGWTWPVWLWVVPVLLGQPFLRAYLLAEHAGCPLVADMLANSRTTFSNAAVRFLAWNMPHHSAHHALPVVPFHRLPRLTALIEARLKITSPGYLAAHRDIRAGWA